MTVRDMLGNTDTYPGDHEPNVLPTGVLEIRNNAGELVALYAAGAWVSVIE